VVGAPDRATVRAGKRVVRQFTRYGKRVSVDLVEQFAPDED
jgi:hypothetical protein